MALTAQSPKKIYIRVEDHTPWTPWANTLAYYKFISDINDYSWNNRNLTKDWTWTVTFANNKVTIPSGSALIYGSGILNWVIWAFTISEWTTWAWSGFMYDADGLWPQWYTGANGSNWNRNGNAIINDWWRRAWNQSTMGSASDFLLLTMVYDWSTLVAYKNWVQFWSTSSTGGSIKWTATQFIIEWGSTFWEIIIEKWAWSATDVANYYDDTKANYWIS